jgi:hypothetical protein
MSSSDDRWSGVSIGEQQQGADKEWKVEEWKAATSGVQEIAAK